MNSEDFQSRPEDFLSIAEHRVKKLEILRGEGDAQK